MNTIDELYAEYNSQRAKIEQQIEQNNQALKKIQDDQDESDYCYKVISETLEEMLDDNDESVRELFLIQDELWQSRLSTERQLETARENLLAENIRLNLKNEKNTEQYTANRKRCEQEEYGC